MSRLRHILCIPPRLPPYKLIHPTPLPVLPAPPPSHYPTPVVSGNSGYLYRMADRSVTDNSTISNTLDSGYIHPLERRVIGLVFAPDTPVQKKKRGRCTVCTGHNPNFYFLCFQDSTLITKVLRCCKSIGTIGTTL